MGNKGLDGDGKVGICSIDSVVHQLFSKVLRVLYFESNNYSYQSEHISRVVCSAIVIAVIIKPGTYVQYPIYQHLHVVSNPLGYV